MQHIPDDLYRQIHATMPIPCVDAIMYHEGHILLCKRTNNPAKGLYWFPGGRVLKGETLHDAVKRKVREETGLEVTIQENLGVDETMFPDGPFGGATHTINALFLVTPSTTDVVMDAQHDALLWCTETPLDAHPYVRTYMERVFRKSAP